MLPRSHDRGVPPRGTNKASRRTGVIGHVTARIRLKAMVTGSAPTVAGVRIGFGTAAFVGALLLAWLLAGCGTLPVHASARPSPTSPTPPPASPPTGPLRVVGLGDSVTSGEHCDCDDYVTAFGRLLSTQEGITVTVANDGES